MNTLRVNKDRTQAADIIDKLMLFAHRYTSINRRKFLLHYFGEEFDTDRKTPFFSILFLIKIITIESV